MVEFYNYFFKDSIGIFTFLYTGNGPPLLLNHGKEFNLIPNETDKVILPCQVINPTLSPQLFKGESSVRKLYFHIYYTSDPQKTGTDLK